MAHVTPVKLQSYDNIDIITVVFRPLANGQYKPRTNRAILRWCTASADCVASTWFILTPGEYILRGI